MKRYSVHRSTVSPLSEAPFLRSAEYRSLVCHFVPAVWPTEGAAVHRVMFRKGSFLDTQCRYDTVILCCCWSRCVSNHKGRYATASFAHGAALSTVNMDMLTRTEEENKRTVVEMESIYHWCLRPPRRVQPGSQMGRFLHVIAFRCVYSKALLSAVF